MITGTIFQNGYICRDIDAAVAEFRQRGDVRVIGPFEADQSPETPAGPRRQVTKLAFVWQGNMQFELIQPILDETGLYGEAGAEPMRHHHVAMRVDDWDTFRDALARQDLPVVIERAIPGDALKFLYIDARAAFGHYLEYVWMTDERWAQIGGLPA